MTGHPPGDPPPSFLPPETGDGRRRGPGDLNELIRQTIDPLQLMQRVADQLVAMIDAADGALVGLLIDPDAIRYVCGAGHLSRFVGEPLALEGSLSGQAIRTGRTLITDDTESDGRVNRQATRSFNVRSSVCVPLGRGEQPVGILNVSSTRMRAFDDHDVALLSGLADFISTVIGTATDLMTITARLCGLRRPDAEPASDADQDVELRGQFVANVLDPAGAERMARRERIERVLSSSGYSIVFQPIFDLHDGEMFGLEALARFGGSPYVPPDVWISEAHDAGLGVELELTLLRAALEHLERLPPRAVLAVNAGPHALSCPDVVEALSGVAAERIVVELTEHVKVEDYPRLADALAGLRASGVRLAIDDAGAGFASLMHILRLDPDFIKLDRQLISGIDLDPVRRSLAGSLMRFAEETGATIIAEGVETGTELGALDELGIRHAQGFYLARPAAIAEIARMGRSGGARVRRKTRGVPLGTERSPRSASLRG